MKKITTLLSGFGVRQLLWTNAGTSQFAGQTVPLNLYGYDAVEVHFFESQIVGRRLNVSQTFYLGVTGVMRTFANLTNGTTPIFIQRRVSASNEGVLFGDGEYRAVTSSGAPTTANDVLVPIAIYGLRKLGGVVRKLLHMLIPERGWAV